MRLLALTVSVILLSACTTTQSRADAVLERGHAIVQANCSSCHATERTGESPYPEAPPFRRLSRNYRVDSLEEAFAEGISVGHPAMPEFQFEPDDVHALVAYLQSIQDRQNPEAH